MNSRIIFGLSVLLALSSCASPETRLRTGLASAGLSPRVSACMAERMVDKLSLLQLKRLASIGSLKDERISDLTVGQFLHKVRALKDTEILTITTKAGLSCAISI